MTTDRLSPFRSVPNLVISTPEGEKTDFTGISARVLGRVAELMTISSEPQLESDAMKTLLFSFMLDTLINGPDADDIDPEIETYSPSIVVYDNLGPVLLNPEFCRSLGSNPMEIRQKIQDQTYVDWAYDAENANRATALVERLKRGEEYQSEPLDYRNGVKNRWTSFGLPDGGGSVRFAESGRHGFLATLALGKGDNLDSKGFVLRMRARIHEIVPETEEELRRQADALVALLDIFDRAWNETPFVMNLWLPNSKATKSMNNPAYVAMTGYAYEDVKKFSADGSLVKRLYQGADLYEVQDAVKSLNEGEIDTYFKAFNVKRANGAEISLGWLRRRYGNTYLSERVRELSNGKIERISQAISGVSFGVATIAKTGEQQVLEDLVKDYDFTSSQIRFE